MKAVRRKYQLTSNQMYFGNNFVFQTRSLRFFIPQQHRRNLASNKGGAVGAKSTTDIGNFDYVRNSRHN